MIEWLLVGGGLYLWGKSKSPAAAGPVAVTEWNRFDSLFQKHGLDNGVDWQWLKAIALNESDLGRERSVKRGMEYPYDIDGSKSSDGKSWGLMQVTLTTARELDPFATEVKLNNPDYSVALAARYLAKLKTYFVTNDGRTTEWIIKSYNQGPGNTRKEMATGRGYANEYWTRFQRNYDRVRKNP